MIKLSKKGDCALKAMGYIAGQDGLVHIKDIAIDQNLSESMLRQIIADLERADLLVTVQGRYGGVKLQKEAKSISVFDILFAIGEELGITDCTKDVYCDKKDDCYTTDVLGKLQKGFNALLKLHTLDKIVKK